jgi:hypothetical protein
MQPRKFCVRHAIENWVITNTGKCFLRFSFATLDDLVVGNKCNTEQGGCKLVIAKSPIRSSVRTLPMLVEGLVIFHNLDISAVGDVPNSYPVGAGGCLPENITPLTRS